MLKLMTLIQIHIVLLYYNYDSLFFHMAGPPVFRTPLEPVTIPVRGRATFDCDVYSNPMLQTISWMFNGVIIVSDNIHITVTDTRLIINNVQREDEGSYSCLVTNQFGSQQSSATLTIGEYCLCVAISIQ